jgi:uncharacterized repeat protein (TIGR02543 family)
VKLGWVFDEWYTESTGGVIYDFSAAVTGDITLYAQWITPLAGAKKELQTAITEAQEAVEAVGTPTTTTWTEGTEAEGTHIVNASGTAADLPVGLYYVSADLTSAIATYADAISTAQTAHGNATTVGAANDAETALATASTTFNNAVAAVTTTPGTKSLAARITGASTNTTIYLYGDEYFAGVTSANISNKTLTLQGVGAERTITLSSAGSMFRVGTSGSLTLGNNVTIKGIATNNSPLIAVTSGGTLTLQGSAKITGNTTNIAYGNTGGSGVQIVGGTFTMTGGTISGNHIPNEGGGGVYVRGIFNMSGGTISGNTANHGAGVFVKVDGGTSTFTMSGSAKITENTAALIGGGVWVNVEGGTGTFTMSGGEISNNAAQVGGGVGIMKGNFNKTGSSSITGNTASMVLQGYNVGKSVLAIESEDPNGSGVRGYRNTDAGTGVNITVTWGGSSYTLSGVETIDGD